MGELLTREPLLAGKGEIDQLGKIFELLGTPDEQSWPGLDALPNFRKFNFRQARRSSLRQRFPPPGPIFDGRPTLSEAGFDLLQRLLALCPVSAYLSGGVESVAVWRRDREGTPLRTHSSRPTCQLSPRSAGFRRQRRCGTRGFRSSRSRWTPRSCQPFPPLRCPRGVGADAAPPSTRLPGCAEMYRRHSFTRARPGRGRALDKTRGAIARAPDYGKVRGNWRRRAAGQRSAKGGSRPERALGAGGPPVRAEKETT